MKITIVMLFAFSLSAPVLSLSGCYNTSGNEFKIEGAPKERLLRKEPAKLDESIKNDVPAFAKEGEMHKSQEDVKSNELIRPSEKKRIVLKVTRYYSPLPKQKRYYTGSYWGDLHLNGGGEKTSSGIKPSVFVIATDPRILPPGSLVWRCWRYYVVGDKGGAIKGKRVDFYTGKGDKGLRRAIHPRDKREKISFRILRVAQK